MAELVICQGTSELQLNPSSVPTFLYRIGSATVSGREVIDINDSVRLNVVAKEIRDEYSEWVYSINKLFLRNRLVTKNLSLFFLTDLSCKRSEFFHTFDTICNLIVVKEKMENENIGKIIVSGTTKQLAMACQSIYPAVEVVCLELKKEKKYINSRRIVSDLRYLSILTRVGLFNMFTGKGRYNDKSDNTKMFYSVFPQMFGHDGRELKYSDFVRHDENYLVSIITDGMHQAVTMSQYLSFRSKAGSNKLHVLDDHFRIHDVLHGVYWFCRTLYFFFNTRKHKFLFLGIDITGLIRGKLRFSLSRVTRLMVVSRAFRRYIECSKIKELVYYPFEYPFGRMISYITRVVNENIIRTGYQMGPVSWRRAEEFLAKGEPSTNPPFIEKAPIPDRVLAEDDLSKQIFEYAGYQNVNKMEKIYRYWYLDEIQPAPDSDGYLIAPGLHDGEFLLSELQSYIENNPAKKFIVKLHPRGDRSYLGRFEGIDNLEISTEEIGHLLAKATVVFVTYSSVGIEAKYLGLDVRIVNMPGRINPTPLLP